MFIILKSCVLKVYIEYVYTHKYKSPSEEW